MVNRWVHQGHRSEGTQQAVGRKERKEKRWKKSNGQRDGQAWFRACFSVLCSPALYQQKTVSVCWGWGGSSALASTFLCWLWHFSNSLIAQWPFRFWEFVPVWLLLVRRAVKPWTIAGAASALQQPPPNLTTEFKKRVVPWTVRWSLHGSRYLISL